MKDSHIAIRDDDNPVVFVRRYRRVIEGLVIYRREDADPEVDPSPPPPRPHSV
jgi:hypothetical protein